MGAARFFNVLRDIVEHLHVHVSSMYATVLTSEQCSSSLWANGEMNAEAGVCKPAHVCVWPSSTSRRDDSYYQAARAAKKELFDFCWAEKKKKKDIYAKETEENQLKTKTKFFLWTGGGLNVNQIPESAVKPVKERLMVNESLSEWKLWMKATLTNGFLWGAPARPTQSNPPVWRSIVWLK